MLAFLSPLCSSFWLRWCFSVSVLRPSNKEGVRSFQTDVMMRERGVVIPYLVPLVIRGPLTLTLHVTLGWTPAGSQCSHSMGDGDHRGIRTQAVSELLPPLPPPPTQFTATNLRNTLICSDTHESSSQLVIMPLIHTLTKEGHRSLH